MYRRSQVAVAVAVAVAMATSVAMLPDVVDIRRPMGWVHNGVASVL